MSDVEENTFQVARYMIETGEKVYTWGIVRQELGLSFSDFQHAYNSLEIIRCCHLGGHPADDQIILVDEGLYSYYKLASRERINLSRDAEQLLKYLVKDQLDFPMSGAASVINSLGWSEKRYIEASQILSDEGFIKGQAADNNPYWSVSMLPEGRKIVRYNFRRPIQSTGVTNTGNYETKVEGNNIIINNGSILKSVSQSVQGNTNLSNSTKDEINSLLLQLINALNEVPYENVDNAEAVAELAKDLVQKATKEKPNRQLVEISAEGLKKAATNVADITPKVLTAATAIIIFIQKVLNM